MTTVVDVGKKQRIRSYRKIVTGILKKDFPGRELVVVDKQQIYQVAPTHNVLPNIPGHGAVLKPLTRKQMEKEFSR